MADQFARGSEEEEGGAGRRRERGCNMGNNSGVVEKSLVAAGRDGVAPPHAAAADPEDRGVLEEKLLLARLELEKTLAVSADADETICKLATVAQRVMQERDEATNHASALLGELQAMRGQATLLLAGKRQASRIPAGPGHAGFAATGYSRGRAPAAAMPYGGMTLQATQLGQYAQAPGFSYCFPSSSSGGSHGAGHCRSLAPWRSIGGTVAADPPAGFAATGYSRGRAPAAAMPYGGMTLQATQLGQYAQAPGSSYCFASSSSGGSHGAGHCRSLAPWRSIGGTVAADPPAGFSLSQDSFDPDMFLVEAAATTGKSCGELGLVVAGKTPLPPRKGKKVSRDAARDHGAGPSASTMQPAATDGGSMKARGGGAGYSLADLVNSAGCGRTS